MTLCHFISGYVRVGQFGTCYFMLDQLISG